MGGLVGLVGHAVFGADGRMQRPGIEPESHLPGVAVTRLFIYKTHCRLVAHRPI